MIKTATDADPNAPTPSQLGLALDRANTRVADLEERLTDQTRLTQDFEAGLMEATERIRHYIFSQQEYIKSLHQRYTQQLQQSRYETIEAQMCHQEWQSGLSRLSEGVREALKSREEEILPWKGKVAGLKEENRILRRKVGWDPLPESEDEDEGDEGGGGEKGRGRGSLGFIGRGAGGGDGGLEVIQ